jgi:hypothetical protein
MILSKKQIQLFNDIISPDVPGISVLGSTQSGKTYDICAALIQYAQALSKYEKEQRNKPDYVPMGVSEEISLFNKYLLDILKKDYNFEKSTYSRDFSVGDVVKIVDVPPQGSAYVKEMSEWLGTYMTIKEQQNRCYLMREDNGKWAWTPSLIEKIVRKY